MLLRNFAHQIASVFVTSLEKDSKFLNKSGTATETTNKQTKKKKKKFKTKFKKSRPKNKDDDSIKADQA